MNTKSCPCHSGKAYTECCGPYHRGKEPENALALMRSRYAAYALGLPDYIIKTTHPKNPSYTTQVKEWARGILDFSQKTAFEGLKILEFVDRDTKATVTFAAYLKQNGHDASFTEKSHFIKVDGHWLYLSGEMSKK